MKPKQAVLADFLSPKSEKISENIVLEFSNILSIPSEHHKKAYVQLEKKLLTRTGDIQTCIQNLTPTADGRRTKRYWKIQ